MASDRDIIRAIAELLDQELFGISMLIADTVCYGGRLEEEKRHERSLEKIKALIPASLQAEFELDRRRAKAASLRAQADALLAVDAAASPQQMKGSG